VRRISNENPKSRGQSALVLGVQNDGFNADRNVETTTYWNGYTHISAKGAGRSNRVNAERNPLVAFQSLFGSAGIPKGGGGAAPAQPAAPTRGTSTMRFSN
jgi:hypothetical protein